MKRHIQMLIATAVVFSAGIVWNEAPRKPAKPLTETETKIAKVFIKAGSPVPVEMAQAIAKTKRKRLMTAVALQESGGDPHAVGKVGEEQRGRSGRSFTEALGRLLKITP